MQQKELLNKIFKDVTKIEKQKVLNTTYPLYTVNKSDVIELFEKIKDFTNSEPNSELKNNLLTFISENEVKINNQSTNFNENIFKTIIQEFRESFLIRENIYYEISQ